MVKDEVILNDRYVVLSKLGAGGMADVYKGRDSMLNRLVAIKVLKKEYRENKDFVRKFISEAQAAAGLMNPNIVNVYDVGEDRGLYYMVMELVEGITLKEYIQKKGRLSTREVLSIAIQMCTGVEAAHSHNIIHRDIKPQNIMISKEGKVKVTDFGIARAVDSNTISSGAMGSVHYVSPEQARGGYCDAKSDIYSVGITMYEMATGRVPFDGDSTVSVAMKHLQENLVPPSQYAPDITRALERIILKCTQKSPERRYASTALLIQDLKRALVDPSGAFVEVTPVRSTMGDTVMISSEELSRKRSASKYSSYDDDYDEDDYDDDDYDDSEDEEDYEERGSRTKAGSASHSHRGKTAEVDPNMNKMMKILTGVAIAIVILILALVIGNAVGVFRFGSGTEVTDEQKEATIEVPNLLGETEAVAKKMCENKNLVMVVVSQKRSDDGKYKEGEVMEQNIAAGELVAKKTEIEVVICSGAEEVTIPDVSGYTQEDAEKALKELGFKSSNIEIQMEYSSEYDNGEVVGTTPAAGEEVTIDTKVVIIISKGAEKVKVPDLSGMTVEQAKKALADANLSDGGATEAYSSTVEAGKIIEQTVKQGKKVDAGTSVGYTVSKGKEPAQTVAVPNVTGKSLADAISALKNKGLYYKEVQADSPSPSGIVVEVDPGEGTSVEIGSTVTLYVSNGSGAGNDGNSDTGDGSNGNNSQN